MTKFDDKYFARFDFVKEDLKKNLENAFRDLEIAKEDRFREVKFNYTYNAFIKSGIALLSFYGRKIKSVPGHHIKIIEKMADILNENSINDIGNLMRSKRNQDFYSGGIEITEKECKEFIRFTEEVLERIKKILSE